MLRLRVHQPGVCSHTTSLFVVFLARVGVQAGGRIAFATAAGDAYGEHVRFPSLKLRGLPQ